MKLFLPTFTPLNRSPRLRLADVPDSDWSESGTSILRGSLEGRNEG
ncbi:MAG: hypothetical protein K2O61_06870 [Bacteroidaceae bacterium]|nr:hypothetical protein [Bacteroidaceae bacterium]